MRFFTVFPLALSLGALLIASPRACVGNPQNREAAIEKALGQYGPFWRRLDHDGPYQTMGARTLLSYALLLCEARQFPERIERLFELATQMQDRDPTSPTYGNLKWSWRDPGVTDQNAVEFCVQDGLPIWLRHRDWLPEPSRQSLKTLLVHAIEGCLRHRPPAGYTNIALLNAGNLIVLGETFSRSEIAEEGYRRLDAFLLWTWAFGIQEYDSPTYYGIDLDGLLFIHSYAQRDSARQQAAALLDLFWTDIALNWFAPASRLAGAQSRTYDYPCGLGYLHRHLLMEGWLSDNATGNGGPEVDPRVKFDGRLWRPPTPLREMNLTRYPRLVRQSWGVKQRETRTHAVYLDVTLSCAGACYGLHDMPLTVDLPGDPNEVRGYFIADGRQDPYGLDRYESSSARHRKALHLQPFWAGAQRGRDALGLAVFRPEDVANAVVTNLQSHFVLRRDVDGLWLRGEPVPLPPGEPEEPARLPVAFGDSLVLRLGSAAVGVRLLWARAQDGSPAAAVLVDDPTCQTLRLTVSHKSDCPTTEPGAAFWVRIGSGLKTDAEFDAWRARFEHEPRSVYQVSGSRLHFEVSGEDGPVSVTADAPYGPHGLVRLQPEPTRALLELDGLEIGRPKLAIVEPIRSLIAQANPLEPIQVPPEGGVYREAEQGLVFYEMTTAADSQASAARYIWQPPPAERRRTAGSVYWPLDVTKAGRYYLWARVRAPNQESDSFHVTLFDGDEKRLGTWHLRVNPDWIWQCFTTDQSWTPTPIDLPTGRCWLQLRPREPGAKIDCLFVTSDPAQRPDRS